ncbi:MAG: GWxTD domain-containing protein [Terriglobia bacterium]
MSSSCPGLNSLEAWWHGHCIRALLLALAAGGLIACAPMAYAGGSSSSNSQEKLTKEQKRREKAIRKEMESPYKKWISGPISYIISPQEQSAFKKLSTDDEREQFIEQFWERRNPNPGDPENEFKEEFYRRIAYANEHFASGIPGWMTDRGRVYVTWGPPDSIESHDSGGSYTMSPDEQPSYSAGASNGSGGYMETYPFEDWYYHYIPGIGENVKLEFVDPTMSGEFHLSMNPCEKDALAETPGDPSGCQGPISRGIFYNPSSLLSQDVGSGYSTMTAMSGFTPENMEEFTQLDTYAKIFSPPPMKFNDLRSVVTHRITEDMLPFKVRTDFVRLTEDAVLVPITVQVANRNLEFQNKNGVMHATLDVFGQLSTLGGRVASTFENTLVLDVPQDEFSAYSTHKSVYQKIIPLRPGHYKLTVVVKDDNSGHMGTTSVGEVVPEYPDGSLESSSLILADLIQQVPTTDVGNGPFIIGSNKVRPSVGDIFNRKQNLGIYMQVYNLGVSPKTHRPDAEIEYELMKNGKTIFASTENASQIQDASSQLTIAKTLPLKPLTPGDYTVAIKVTDNIKKKTISPTAAFVLQ